MSLSAFERLQGLEKKAQELNEKRIRLNAILERAQKEREELEAQLVEEYKTSDPEELSRILKEKEAENERLVNEYEENLNTLERALKELQDALVSIGMTN